MDCRAKEVFQGAILRYSGAPETESEEDLTFQNTEHSGKVQSDEEVDDAFVSRFR